MPVQILYKSGRGNTVPYPPLVDSIRINAGFVDLRGNVDAVRDIPEATRSTALASLLRELAQAGSPVVSLGCDLGSHREKDARLDSRCVAGGYIQVADARMKDIEGSFLKSMSATLEEGLRRDVADLRWKVRFELASVVYELEERVEAHSVWIWFFARASVADKAELSRERPLTCLSKGFERFAEQRAS